jgi:hypothetical protein
VRRLAIGVVAVLAAALALPAPVGASAGQWSIFEDHTALVQSGVPKRIDTLDKIKFLGPDTLRIEFRWKEIAPSPGSKTKPSFDASNPASYQGALNGYPGFGQYDDLVLRAHAMGFRLFGTITGDAPRWATAGGKGRNYKVNSSAYADFAEAVARRYAGNFSGLPTIHYFSIWNEPNHKDFLQPLSAGPALYRRLVEAGVPAIHRGGVKDVNVFVGETAPSGVAGKSTGPRAFMQRWLCLNKRWKKVRSGSCRHFKKVKADGYAHHPYDFAHAPNYQYPGADNVTIGTLSRLTGALDKLSRTGALRMNGGGRMPLYLTEYGYFASGHRALKKSLRSKYLKQAQSIALKNPRVKSQLQYLLVSPARGERASFFDLGLVAKSGARNVGYNALKRWYNANRGKVKRPGLPIALDPAPPQPGAVPG